MNMEGWVAGWRGGREGGGDGDKTAGATASDGFQLHSRWDGAGRLVDPQTGR